MPDVGNTQYPTADDAEPRLARERRLLDEARAEAARGLLLSGPEVEAWLDALDGDVSLPPPKAAERRAGR
ncbi:hypothetical protein GCM10011317_51810 [Niveispirillum cyanobacteriorum]|nr:hypothetical protein GCM10011317_51810 [Niveispirillum cyanobacteriorum]